MPIRPESTESDYTESNQAFVDETVEIFTKYSNERDSWARQAKEDKEFRLGRQWTVEQEETLKSRGQAPIVVNRIHPAVEAAKSMLTANRPSFRVAPREDSDNKISQVMSALLSYMYDISDGESVIKQSKVFVCHFFHITRRFFLYNFWANIHTLKATRKPYIDFLSGKKI